jgi:hypothetical protein
MSYNVQKNVYSVGSTFIATVNVDVFQTGLKSLVVRAQRFRSYQHMSSPPRKTHSGYQALCSDELVLVKRTYRSWQSEERV